MPSWVALSKHPGWPRIFTAMRARRFPFAINGFELGLTNLDQGKLSRDEKAVQSHKQQQDDES